MQQMALAVLVQGTGAHPASWMLTESEQDPATDIGYYTRAAQLAERGCFDLFFIADTPAARTENLHAWSRFPMFMNVFEPVTLLSAVAAGTKHIGLGATASTSFYEPYNLARLFASLDHLSHGRAAWNIVTSANDYAARNFGLDKLPPHGERYERAHEFVDIVKALWDSWEDDAFSRDKVSGRNFDPAKLHVLDHAGKFFKLHGALNIARSPQGQPVLIQAGSSNTGKDFAAETAEVVFASDTTVEKGRTFYNDLKARVVQFGRTPESLKILAGMPIVIGSSEAEAEDKYQALQEMIHPDVGRMRLSTDLEIDLSNLPVDEPIPPELIPEKANFHQTYFAQIADMARKGMTLRQIYMNYERGLTTVRGTPIQIADRMQEWMEGGAADGFMLLFHTMPGGLRDFVEQVAPELQRRGLMRTAYSGSTLRDHLGLQRPANRYVSMAQTKAPAAATP
jgi:FMN-dependent oxidoreductase (nitrilotriacetate monooxygenase family)